MLLCPRSQGCAHLPLTCVLLAAQHNRSIDASGKASQGPTGNSAAPFIADQQLLQMYVSARSEAEVQKCRSFWSALSGAVKFPICPWEALPGYTSTSAHITVGAVTLYLEADTQALVCLHSEVSLPHHCTHVAKSCCHGELILMCYGAAGDVQDALHDVGDRLSASLRPRRDAPLFNFGIGASLGLSQGGVQPIVCFLLSLLCICSRHQ